VKQILSVVALYLMAHACGVPGHLEPNPEETGAMMEGSTGDEACIMRYMDPKDNGRLVILQTLMKLDRPMSGAGLRIRTSGTFWGASAPHRKLLRILCPGERRPL